MELAAINSPAAAFVAGLVTSLHCAVMCGPLACMMAPARGDPADPQAVATVYHLARLTAYAALGAVAATLGAATPLLPCGPLYFLVALAALAGSALRGTEFMLAFGLGTLPLLWLAQANFGKLNRFLAPGTVARVQSGLALTTALVLAWRLRGTLGFVGPDASAFLCTLP